MPNEASARLLVEIGCEELPARLLPALAQGFAQNLKLHLQEMELLEAETAVEVAATPRRLLCCLEAVRLSQPEREEVVTGPPTRLAFTLEGQLSPQGLGFAAKNSVSPEAVFRLTNPKGEYLAVRRKLGGAAAAALLLELIPKAFLALPLPRSMRWDESGLRFLRPVRWLLALHGNQLIPFRLGSLTAAATSRGHRTLGQASFPVAGAADFPLLWERNSVLAAPALRRLRITAAAATLLQMQGLRLRADAGLEETLVNLTERPEVMFGSFDPTYLDSLPAEVLVTVMRDHQKYFAVETAAGALAPHFVAVLNQPASSTIRHGNERVLRARFSDAQFFFNADRQRRLEHRLALLEGVTFQVRLGSYRAKSLRLRALAAWLARQWNLPDAEVAWAEQAAELAKCDLTTDMVKEFPELQGIMGGHYARAEGLPEPLAQAIADQYAWELPPSSNLGAAVSLADKLDTIAGMFALGEIPTGSADPFALRRQANGIVRTLIERHLPLSLAAAIAEALAAYGLKEGFASAQTVQQTTAEFFKERLSFYLRDVLAAGANLTTAVLASGSDDPLDAARRLQALQSAPDMAAVAAVVKRARSIVRKEGGLDRWCAQPLNEARLSAPAEQALRAAVAALPSGLDLAAELTAMAALAAPLERFFNDVRVNDDDPVLRANRLALLASTVARLNRIADFAEM